ncbi:MAG: formyl transferase [Crocinitomicaceae bacterium]|nr:formyl transferase [Crocinitomicaceae bacterium]|tara:strand:- start:5659 stop:6423 length:765 start_codon:yes stop_codon:yes gene_type:complete
MKIVIITQDEPFYLANNLRYLIKTLPAHSKIVGCVVADASPFGKKSSFIDKAKQTLLVFGIGFFVHYSIKYVLSKLNPKKKVHRVLKEHQIPAILLDQPINSPESVEKIKAHQPELLISILGNQIFKEPIINLAPKGCLNLHTALLPKYRGLMPTFWVLKHREKETGVSVFFVDKGIDSGPIVVQERVEIGNMTQEQLIVHTKKIGMESIAKAVDLIENDNVELIENNNELKTYYSFPTRADVIEFRKGGKRFY